MTRFAAGLIAALALAPVAYTGSTGAFAVAVLRRDGAMIPIGTFTGRKWEVSWPAESYDKLDIPITTDAVPKRWWGDVGRRDEWQLWTDGVSKEMVHVVSPRVAVTMCEGRMALATDYRSPDAPPPNVQPYPKAGIAVSPPTAVSRVVILDASSPDWGAIARPLKQAFDEAEDRLAIAWTRENDPHPIPRKERLATPVTIEALYASDDNGGRIEYVEASRKYDHSNDDRAICAVAFGGLFFRSEANNIRPIGGDMRVVPCDRRGLVYMLPFGAMRLNDRLFWVTQYSGWDFEQYNILEFEKSSVKVAASTYGGRCANRDH